jgi:hypothetical protein
MTVLQYLWLNMVSIYLTDVYMNGLIHRIFTNKLATHTALHRQNTNNLCELVSKSGRQDDTSVRFLLVPFSIFHITT